MRIVDAHQHFWKIGGPGHSWPDAEWPRIHRDFGPDDLRDEAGDLDLVGTVLVQSQPDDRDTDWMCATVGNDPLVRAIVGWVDFERADAAERIADLAGRDKLVGLRPMLQAIDDSNWILRDDIVPAIAAMIAHGLRFDALVQPRHLKSLRRFAVAWPDLPIVIDHGAKPFAATGELDPWRDDMTALAALPNIWCKLSGLRTEQAPGQQTDALRPYVAHILKVFGQRTMWGSDWPVLLHTGDSYGDWVRDTRALAGALNEAAEQRLFAGAAMQFYGLDA
ncbi:amidohydrolase family protein [Stakelama saccharophila]|uniref:Amidohydrolase family protein n=1 Tax=Stakelama saccharophila TaxID=3075605 RepID=A0ABZ0B4U4_9SPHN|nr:amidohydrolase family protein [Stakelama sp. W311]WNO52393.1 amidohydrolase family protein [Stakelama sp. W311]